MHGEPFFYWKHIYFVVNSTVWDRAIEKSYKKCRGINDTRGVFGVIYANWLCGAKSFLISPKFHWSGINLWPLKGEVNTTDSFCTTSTNMKDT